MKVKFGFIKDVIEAIGALAEGKMSYSSKLYLRKIEETLAKEADWFEKQRHELIAQCADKDENGQLLVKEGLYVIDEKDKFNERFEELLNTEFELVDITEDLINDVEDLKITGSQWNVLIALIGNEGEGNGI